MFCESANEALAGKNLAGLEIVRRNVACFPCRNESNEALEVVEFSCQSLTSASADSDGCSWKDGFLWTNQHEKRLYITKAVHYSIQFGAHVARWVYVVWMVKLTA